MRLLDGAWGSSEMWFSSEPDVLTSRYNFAAIEVGALGSIGHILACGCAGCMSKIQIDLDTPGGESLRISGLKFQPSLASTTGNLSLALGDDIADGPSSTTSISVGASLASSIQSLGDLDYIRVNLVAGQTYTFAVQTTSGALDPYVELRTSTGAVIEAGVEDDDGGIFTNSLLMYRPTVSGDYFIVVRSWANAQGGQLTTGDYSLAVNAITTGNTSPTTFADNGKPFFSWDEAAIQITRDGASWATAFSAPVTVTYAFRSTAPGDMPDDTGGFSRFSAAQISAAEAALAAWAAVANITFVRVQGGNGYSNNASILFGNYATGAAGASAFAFLPVSADTSAASVQGDVWINNSLSDNNDLSLGGFGLHVLLHEIGHALGLTHPGEYNAGEGVSITYPVNAEYFNDSRMFTAMSYFASSNTAGTLPGFSSIPQLHDIAAIQRLYGANMASRTGDTIYGFNSNTGVPAYTLTLASQGAVFAVWDAGGTDTLDFSGYATNSTLDLREEAFSSVGPDNGGVGLAVFNISIARGAVIENAIGGTGNDTIIGNAAANQLAGNAGADSINGGAGVDTSVYAGLSSTSASWHRNPDGTWTVTAGAQGTDTLTDVEFLDFSDRDVFLERAASNFNGDGVSDILWRNTTGTISIWGLNANQQITYAGGWTVGNEWQIQKVGDFNGDGVSDILWRNTDGTISIWELDASQQITYAGGWAVGNEWQIQEVGDFNGDGVSDILWRNTTGTISIWGLDANQQITYAGGWTVGNEWQIQEVGDFNGDGVSDILWRNTDGTISIWELDASQQITYAGGWTVGNEWQIQEVGDFTGDGVSDILWRNTDGTISIWELDVDQKVNYAGGWTVGNEWLIEEVGDFNGDGVSDILWRNTDGTISIWELDATLQLTNAGGWTVGNEWQII